MKKIMICLAVMLTTGLTSTAAQNETKVKQFTLSNGVSVHFHQTNDCDNGVTMYALSNGGTSLYTDVTPANLKVVNECLAFSGVAGYSQQELQKTMKENEVSVTPHVGRYEEYITSHSSTNGLETMFRVNNLYFSSLRSDLNAFTSWRDSLRAEIDSKGKKTSHGLSREDLDVVNYDLVMQLAAQRFSNVGDFTFVITGNVSEAELMPLLNKYIATLHTNGKYEVPNYDATSNSLNKR